jgi:predicted DNA binding CopG/RHH family protein
MTLPEMRPPLTDEEGNVRELTEEDFRNMRPLSEVDPTMLEVITEWRRELARETVAVSINLPETDLKHIDEFASAHGLTRSEFLLRAAILEMERS